MPCRWSVVVLSIACAAGPLAAQSSRPAGLAAASWVLAVYQPDGTVQCENRPLRPLAMGAAVLMRRGATVLSQQNRALPGLMSTQCGAPTGRVNYYEVMVSNETMLLLDREGTEGFHPWREESRTAVVTLPTDPSCRPSAEASAARLAAAGVTILGRMEWMASQSWCGGNVALPMFRIPAADLRAARFMKFREHATRLPVACEGVTIPDMRSADSVLVTPAGGASMIIPDTRGIPREWKHRVIRVTFFPNLRGTVDSVWTQPSLPQPMATTFGESMKGYHFTPGVFDGCAVGATAKIDVTFGGR